MNDTIIFNYLLIKYEENTYMLGAITLIGIASTNVIACGGEKNIPIAHKIDELNKDNHGLKENFKIIKN